MSRERFRSSTQAVLTLLCCLSLGPTAFGAWVQWRVADGGNGHWYRLTTTAGTWHDAENEAVASGGHLVTINDAAEQQWLVTTFGLGGQFSAWIGFTDEAVEGTWLWVAGDGGTWQQTELPPCTGPCDGVGTSYVDWHVYGDGEPNDNATGPGEDWALIGEGIDGMHWGDYSPTSANYYDQFGIIEHATSAWFDCNANGIPDAQDIADCTGLAWCGDCNDNGIPDGCDIAPEPPMFGDRLEVSVVDEPNGIAVADLSDPPDGILDMIVGRDHGGSVAVYYGQSARSFGKAVNYALSPNPGTSHVGFAVDDFDHDGRLDFATATHRFGNSVSVLYGQPAGGFGEQFTVGGGNQPAFLAKADFDGDHILDLAVTNVVPFGPPGYVSILKGAPDGTFSVIANPAVGQYPYGIATGDFNHDGIPDLVTANSVSGNVSVLIGAGNGQFQTAQDFLVGIGSYPNSGPFFVVVGRFNADAYDDLAVTIQADNRVVVLYGQPTGLFDSVAHRRDILVGDGPVGIASADLNHDGFLDLVCANFIADSVSVLLGDAQGAFGIRQDFAVGEYPLHLALADFDRDGWEDIAVTCDLSDTVTILYNRAAWGRSEDCDANGVPDECQPDCDHDGTPDVCELPPFGDGVDCNRNGIPDACEGFLCDDGNPCTDDTCAGTVCVFTANTNPCDDGSACTVGDTCSGGTCTPGAPRDCEDGVACTRDVCDPASGACVSTPDDSRCDDGLFCTGVEICDAAEGCQPGTLPNCDDGVVCTVDSCNEASDACAHVLRDGDHDGVCDDDDACPQSDRTPTIVIGGCSTGVSNRLLGGGCTISDEIAACAAGARNHGAFVSCVAQITNEWERVGLITGAEKGRIQSCAGRADIPRR